MIAERAPILTVLSCAKARSSVARVSAVPTNSAEMLILIFVSSLSLDFSRWFLDARIVVKLVHIGLQSRVGETVDDLSMLNDQAFQASYDFSERASHPLSDASGHLLCVAPQHHRFSHPNPRLFH